MYQSPWTTLNIMSKFRDHIEPSKSSETILHIKSKFKSCLCHFAIIIWSLAHAKLMMSLLSSQVFLNVTLLPFCDRFISLHPLQFIRVYGNLMVNRINLWIGWLGLSKSDWAPSMVPYRMRNMTMLGRVLKQSIIIDWEGPKLRPQCSVIR